MNHIEQTEMMEYFIQNAIGICAINKSIIV